MSYVAGFAKRVLIHAFNLATLMSHNFVIKAITLKCRPTLVFNLMIGKSSHKNFEVVAQLQTELHLYEAEKLDACIRPF